MEPREGICTRCGRPFYLEAYEERGGVCCICKRDLRFSQGKTFDKLVDEQGVYPITSGDQLTNDWPVGADFDRFLAAVRSARGWGKE